VEEALNTGADGYVVKSDAGLNSLTETVAPPLHLWRKATGLVTTRARAVGSGERIARAAGAGRGSTRAIG